MQNATTYSNNNLTMNDANKEILRKNIRIGAELNFTYLLMTTLATIIACYGLFANSPAVVIGAMIVAMLLGPITGVALALVDSDIALLKKTLVTLFAGVIGVMLTAYVIGIAHQEIPLTSEIMARTAPNLVDLMIALAGGAAGAYATVSPRLSGAFIGVAIATALVPPLSVSSILLARGEYHLAFNAFSLAFANIIAIQFASSAVMWFTGLRHVDQKKKANIVTFLKRNTVSLLILGMLACILANNLKAVINKQVYENRVTKILSEEIAGFEGSHVAEVRFETTSGISIIRAVVRGPHLPSASDVKNLEEKLPSLSNNLTNELRIRFVQTVVVNRNGLLYNEKNAHQK